MSEHWIAAWGCAITKPIRRTAEWTRDTTLRMQMKMPIAGEALRFHFSNLFGEQEAVSGSRVLREYPCDLYCHYGPRGLDRFEREVLLPGVKKVFILHGINDIIHPMTEGNPHRPITDLPTAEELIEALQYYIDTAHAHGIAVLLAPILPFGGWRTYSEEREAIREKVNYWIYREAPVEGILPFETALLNPEEPLALLPEYDSGDHLHPSGAGAQVMAESIPKEFI